MRGLDKISGEGRPTHTVARRGDEDGAPAVVDKMILLPVDVRDRVETND